MTLYDRQSGVLPTMRAPPPLCVVLLPLLVALHPLPVHGVAYLYWNPHGDPTKVIEPYLLCQGEKVGMVHLKSFLPCNPADKEFPITSKSQCEMYARSFDKIQGSASNVKIASTTATELSAAEGGAYPRGCWVREDGKKNFVPVDPPAALPPVTPPVTPPVDPPVQPTQATTTAVLSPPPPATDPAATSAGAAVSIVAMASANTLASTQGSRLKTFMKLTRCPPDTDSQDMDFLDSPTGMGRRSRNVARHQMVLRREMLIGNLIMIAGILFFHFVIAVLIHQFRARRGKADFNASLAVARFPSFSVFPFLVLFQPVATPALTLLYYVHEPLDVVLAVFGLIILFISMAYVLYITRSANFQCVLVRDLDVSRCGAWVWGQYSWSSVHQDDSYERRYALIFRDFVQKYRWFMLVDLVILFIISAVAAIIPTNTFQCATQAIVMAFSEGLFVVIICATKPFLAPLDHWLAVAVACLQMLGLIFALVNILHEDEDVQEGMAQASRISLLASTVLLVAKALLDLGNFLIERWGDKSHRKELRLLEFERARLKAAQLECEQHLEDSRSSRELTSLTVPVSPGDARSGPTEPFMESFNSDKILGPVPPKRRNYSSGGGTTPTSRGRG
eukprot:Sspe_Gene.37424::Locus_18063_Transcript_1_1_Confidence_1.000_Length_2975::g.37424::m.37424